MRVQSLVYDNFRHVLVEVEVTLHPGLPGIQILGLPDAVVKDCVWRIKSAFLRSGFKWPSASQVIVNLKPSNLRKRGTGLDLAIAAALLWETGQSQAMQPGTQWPLLYGELDLLGEVHTPPDFIHFNRGLEFEQVLTGPTQSGLPFPYLSISALKDLAIPSVVAPSSKNQNYKRPVLPKLLLSEKLAEIVSVVAAGEHPTLLSGRAGTGKTTVSHIIHALIDAPSLSLSQEYGRYHAHNPITWRPFRNPHHSASALAIIGGGPNVQPGELTRAHGGVLLLDEFLEFESSVQESLREPMERGVIELIRCSKAQTLPAKFLLLATANLCKCGEFEPGLEDKCSCGHLRRRRYLDRLSGPILDRFAVVAFSSQWEGQKTVKLSSIFERVQRAIKFRKETRKNRVVNCHLSVDILAEQLAPYAHSFFAGETWASERRAQHLLRVARTLADLDESESISLQHLETSRHLTANNITKLKRASHERILDF